MTSVERGGHAKLERRALVAESLSTVTRLMAQLEAALERESGAAPIDRQGALREAVRAVLPIAVRTAGFDVTLATGHDPKHAVRVRHGVEGVTVALLTAAPPRTDRDGDPTSTAAQLAALLRSGRSVVLGSDGGAL